MLRLVILLSLLGGCARSEQAPISRESDPLYQEIKKLVEDQSNCFTREAQSSSLKKVDLDTAALAVMGRCATERQRYKVFSARNTIEMPPQFEIRWRAKEANDLLFIKQMLAIIRTN